MSDWMSEAEAAEHLNLKVRSIRTLRANGDLAFSRMAGKVRIHRADLDTFAVAQRQKAAKSSHPCPIPGARTPVERRRKRAAVVNPKTPSDLRKLLKEQVGG